MGRKIVVFQTLEIHHTLPPKGERDTQPTIVVNNGYTRYYTTGRLERALQLFEAGEIDAIYVLNWHDTPANS